LSESAQINGVLELASLTKGICVYRLNLTADAMLDAFAFVRKLASSDTPHSKPVMPLKALVAEPHLDLDSQIGDRRVRRTSDPGRGTKRQAT
jgi:hypothetical protein